MGAPTDNVFDYFGSDLEEIFKIGQEGIEALADAYNESGRGTSIRQFIKATERHVDPELADLYRFPLAAAAIEYYFDGKGAQRRLSDSNLTPRTKKAIQAFFSRKTSGDCTGCRPNTTSSGNCPNCPPGGRNRMRRDRTNQ